MGGTVATLMTITAYLVLASVVTSFVIEDVEGITIRGMEPTQNTNTSFLTISNMSSLNAVVTSGTWELSSTQGLYSTTPEELNEIFFTLTNQTEGWFNNSYHVVNPNSLEHGFYIYDTGFSERVVEVEEEGFFYRDTLDRDFYHYPDAASLTEYNITTSFNTEDEWVTVTLDDTNTIIFSVPASTSFLGTFFEEYFAGVYSSGSGLEIHSLSSLFSITFEQTNFSLGDFISTMAVIVFWNVDSTIIPVWMNLLFIKVPGIGVGFIILQLFRGTG